MQRVVVIGGGISGLVSALNLRDLASDLPQGVEILLLESAARPGGNIRTEHADGFTLEWGPNGYLDNVPTTPALVRRLGLESEVQRADESAANRYLYRSGRLHLLPSGPLSFLRSPVLSFKGRLRVLLESFAAAPPEAHEETIFDFASRRIGEEAARILIDAMVSGVFAGNIHELSFASTFPKMAEMEAAHGSLTRAMLARMGERRAARRRVRELRAADKNAEELTRPGGPAGPGGRLTSFKNGLATLVSRLTAELGDSVRLNQRVVAIEPANEQDRLAGGSAWTVRIADGTALAADAVLVTLPSPLAGPLLGTADRGLGEDAARIPTAPLVVIGLGYDVEALGKAPHGFGFLVPRGEGPRILGCLWDSSVFPGRAPAGKVLVRAMIGGAHDHAAVELDDASLVSKAREDLKETMGLQAQPILTRIYRHPLGIGQYLLGHQRLLESIEARLESLPGLWVAGSSYYGVSMNACIEKAVSQSQAIMQFLAGRQE